MNPTEVKIYELTIQSADREVNMTQVVEIFKVWVLIFKMIFIKKNGIPGSWDIGPWWN